MKILSFLTLSIVLFACVPAKKYNDLLAKEKKCSEALAKYKSNALDSEGLAKNLTEENKLLLSHINQLKQDTSSIGNKYRMLQAQYDRVNDLNMTLEKEFDKAKSKDALETAKMTADLQAKILEAQRKEDALLELERELNKKERLLADREARVKELEEIIAKQEAAVNALKEKIALALRGFTDKGLTVEEKDGKIYVSLEAKLLFASGSTLVESEGKQAILQLAKAIEGDDQLEIIVEGHTDTDALKSASYPKNNWELSVLRATSVVDIMINNSTIEPKILTAAGRSEFHPVSESDKAKNRRIEVIIAPNLNALYDIISK